MTTTQQAARLPRPPIRHLGLDWHPVLNSPNFLADDEWLYEASYKNVRVSCGYNENGPQAFVGHPTADSWFDSVACDGTFEDGARRAVEFADELMARDYARKLLGLPNPPLTC